MKSVIAVVLAAVSLGKTYIMKSILTLFIIFTTTFDVFALPQNRPDMNQMVEQIMDKCFAQNGIDRSTLTDESMNSDEPAMKCFHACMAKETRVMNSDGTINKQALLTFPNDMPEDLKQHLTQARAPCTELKGSDECDTAYLLFKCMFPKSGSN